MTEPCRECPDGTLCPLLGIRVGPPQRRKCAADPEWRERTAATKAAGCAPRDRGLGDSLERVFKAVGVDKIAKAVERATGRPCGCAERKAKLNSLVPYGDSSPPAVGPE